MKLRTLLLLTLLLTILLPLTSIFHSSVGVTGARTGIGNSVVLVTKESNIYARIQIVVQPFLNNSNVVVGGPMLLPVRLAFPNGTSVAVTKPMTFTIILTNNAVIGGSTWASGPGYEVSPDDPISVQVLSGQNATSDFLQAVMQTVPGIDMYPFTLSGDYQFSVQVLGVSL